MFRLPALVSVLASDLAVATVPVDDGPYGAALAAGRRLPYVKNPLASRTTTPRRRRTAKPRSRVSPVSTRRAWRT
jgi:hypothetical protein